jgi:hypothetical protein
MSHVGGGHLYFEQRGNHITVGVIAEFKQAAPVAVAAIIVPWTFPAPLAVRILFPVMVAMAWGYVWLGMRQLARDALNACLPHAV